MDFSLSKTQHEIRERVHDFSRANFGTRAALAGDFRKKWAKCAEIGLTGLCVSPDLGGSGFGAFDTALAIEAFARGCVDQGLTFALSAHLLAAVLPVQEFGSPELKKKYLPGVAAGQLIFANAITEAESGSDAFAMRARATRSDRGFVLNGIKSYVSNGTYADAFLVYVLTNPDHGFLGISAFVAERGDPGLRVGETIETLGLRSSAVASVYLADCGLSSSRLVGAEGQGAVIFRRSMLWERSCLFAGYLGLMERQLEQAVEYAGIRKQFAKPIGSFQSISHRIADMKLRLEASRLLLYKACWSLDQGEDAELDVSLAKLMVSESAIQASLDSLQIHGGIGYTLESGIGNGLVDSVASTVFSGTSEILRELIAKRLGL